MQKTALPKISAGRFSFEYSHYPWNSFFSSKTGSQVT